MGRVIKMADKVVVEVVDKGTQKVIWSEPHKNEAEADQAIEEMMCTHFNPEHFKFRKRGAK